ncbi:MAG: alpha/beta fold hydrolase [Micromonosporaceae bacterium]
MSDTPGVLGRLGVPVLVLVGEHDRVTGVAESERLAGAIPGARLAVIPAAGHAAIQERPTEIAGLVAEFLRYVQNERA